MMEDIRGRRLLDAGRGQPPADRLALAAMLIGLGRIGLDHDAIAAMDVNPVILVGARPVVADAFIALT
jgi:acetyl-CoA synthetase (ADP-forming)